MAEKHMGFVNKAYDLIYGSDTVEEVEEKLKGEMPKYDPCDTTLDSPYDSAFKEAHSDKVKLVEGMYCLEPRMVCVVQDKPFNPPTDCCCCCEPPEPEKPFKRPTADCPQETHTEVPCDSRVETITTGHYAMKEVDEAAEEYFNKPQVVEGKGEEGSNFVVSQPNTNEPDDTPDNDKPVKKANTKPRQ